MNLLLKIVEGPNKGAEIALVEGVAVTLGKGDDCDIVLADATLPDAPMGIEATADSVTVGGEALELFHVKTLGSTSLAVGPADSPWSELVWPKSEPEEAPEAPETAEKGAEPAAAEAESPKPEAAETSAKEKKSGCLICLLAAAVLLLIAAGVCWFCREQLRPYARMAKDRAYAIADRMSSSCGRDAKTAGKNVQSAKAALESIAAKYALAVSGDTDRPVLSGNLKSRRERLAATAEAYASCPGVDVDITDDESFRTSAEDALFTLTEGALKVAAATNRVLRITGHAPSVDWLKSTLESLSADMPKLRNVDVSGVSVAYAGAGTGGVVQSGGNMPVARKPGSTGTSGQKRPVNFPVCGILTVPYPCLVMKNGARVLEGAAFGDGIIEKIEADSVTLTNSTGRFTWKP